jgi:hypothetical protein
LAIRETFNKGSLFSNENAHRSPMQVNPVSCTDKKRKRPTANFLKGEGD